MFYRISLFVNTTIGSLFIILALIGIATDKKIALNEIVGITLILSLYSIFLWFNFICIKVNRSNKENTLISFALKRTGDVLFVFNLIAAVIITICVVAATATFLTVGNPNAQTTMWLFYLGFIVVFFLSGVTAIINALFFKKEMKINKLLVNDFINDIGQQP
ncbi:MAG: hypothetical protein WCG67_06125 [Ferruginibacter sp.]